MKIQTTMVRAIQFPLTHQAQKPTCDTTDLSSNLTQFIGGSKWGRQGRAPRGSKFFHFHAVFSKKFAKIIPIWELAHPPGENPESATAHCRSHALN